MNLHQDTFPSNQNRATEAQNGHKTEIALGMSTTDRANSCIVIHLQDGLLSHPQKIFVIVDMAAISSFILCLHGGIKRFESVVVHHARTSVVGLKWATA